MLTTDGNRTDGQLLASYLEGSQEAFEDLVRRHTAVVRQVCRAVVGTHGADDAVQAAFLALATKAATLTAATSVAGWLVHVARQIALNLLRSHQRQRLSSLPEEIMVASTPRPDVEYERSETDNLVTACLAGLPGRYRDPIILHHLEGLTLEQCAQRLSSHPGTVASQVHRGLAMMRDRLQRRGLVFSLAMLGSLTAAGSCAAADSTFDELVRTVAAQSSQVRLAGLAKPVSRWMGWTFGAGILAGVLLTLVAVWLAGPVRSLRPVPITETGATTSQSETTVPPAQADPQSIAVPFRGPTMPIRTKDQGNPASLLATASATTEAIAVGGRGRIGPLWWTRALDLGEDAVATAGSTKGSLHLWCYQYKLDARSTLVANGRNNFLAQNADLGFSLRLVRTVINSGGAHHLKVLIGYVPAEFAFTNGDHRDLLHQANCPRVVLNLPVRHVARSFAPVPGEDYLSDACMPYFGIVALGPGEEPDPAWFAAPRQDPHLLCDLDQELRKRKRIHPDRDRPIVRFDLLDQGGWRLRIKWVGRDGLAGGEVDGDWDLVRTADDPGCRRHPFTLDSRSTRWALSIFNPGGNPADSSQIEADLEAYHRHGGVVPDDLEPGVRQRTSPLP